ncbi:DNA polymerase III subunit gamma and tau [Nakamurella sp. UYEF19]|uniref:DNA polymerase III subunit gamma and tau n=1 Tax=Nakamurella sp. UYEF19 TaxID=1756392 RepID=UPI003395DE95
MALYRKYRPATFAEVVGQEHVTEPLRTALAAGRINHAYLFSGPRGCGKTSSARILARSLNCVQGPTPDPCGVCPSCIALAPEGPGSLDVIELDAASHGGVNDTRDLRDRAFYMPAESRYRVFIIDEAHMVSKEGFNALLKIVEEPPEHLIFIFATTEPDKVLTTIRSRTHHYPFRLIPPATLRSLLERLCAEEGVVVESAVFPLVVQAGGGSARDSLSILDQLMAGAGDDGVTYRHSVALLGVTDAALLDEMADALAAGDGSSVFGVVDKVVEAGHDPRRFAADLLQRMRDLVVLGAVPDAAGKGLIDAPEDQLALMSIQVERLGTATVSRFAEVLHTGLVEMRGTTSPRLVLELMCARMLLPAASLADGALLQRLERMERRMSIAGEDPGPGTGEQARAIVPPPPAVHDPAPVASNSPASNSPASNSPASNSPIPNSAPAASRTMLAPPTTAGLPPSGRSGPPTTAAPTREAPPEPSDRQSQPVERPAAVPATPAAQVSPEQRFRRASQTGAPMSPDARPSAAPSGSSGGRREPGSANDRQQSGGPPGTRPATAPSLGLPAPPRLSGSRPTQSGKQAAPAVRSQNSADDRAPSGTQGRADRSPAQSTRSDRPQAERPQGERPPGERPPGERPPGARPRAEQPTSEQPTSDQPTSDQPGSDQPGSDRAASDRAASDRATARPTSATASPRTEPARTEQVSDSAPPASTAARAGDVDVTDVRRVWNEVLTAVQRHRRTTQILLASATVASVSGSALHLTMPAAGMARRVVEPANADLLRAALKEVLGVDWAIRCDAADGPAGQGSGPGNRPPPGPAGPQNGRVGGPVSDLIPPPDEEEIPDDYGDEFDPTAPRAAVRDPEEMAIELLTTQLGAKRLEP